MADQDQLSPEDYEALRAVYQHLQSTGDPRASKVQAYLSTQIGVPGPAAPPKPEGLLSFSDAARQRYREQFHQEPPEGYPKNLPGTGIDELTGSMLGPGLYTSPFRTILSILTGAGASKAAEATGMGPVGQGVAGLVGGGLGFAGPSIARTAAEWGPIVLHPKTALPKLILDTVKQAKEPSISELPLGYSVKPGQVMTPRSQEPLGYKVPAGQPLQNIGSLPLGYKVPSGESLPDVGSMPLGYKGPAPPSPRTIEDFPLGYKSPPGQKMTPVEPKIAPTPEQTRPVTNELSADSKLKAAGQTKDDKIAQYLHTQKVTPEDWMAMDEMTKNFHIKNADPKFRPLGKGGPLGRSVEQGIKDIHIRLQDLWGR